MSKSRSDYSQTEVQMEFKMEVRGLTNIQMICTLSFDYPNALNVGHSNVKCKNDMDVKCQNNLNIKWLNV